MGIETLQIPMAVFVTFLIMLVPTKPNPVQRGLRNGLAFAVGWFLMLMPAVIY
jgi:hypothetical protein